MGDRSEPPLALQNLFASAAGHTRSCDCIHGAVASAVAESFSCSLGDSTRRFMTNERMLRSAFDLNLVSCTC